MPASSARGRPLPSGELKLHHALIWMALQGAVGAAVLFKLNKFAGGVALLSLLLVAIYPTMKKITSWPQVVLGFAFNWGALVGYAAVDREPVVGHRRALSRWCCLDDGLRHDLRHAGPARRRRGRREVDRAPLRRRARAGSRCSPCSRSRCGPRPACWRRWARATSWCWPASPRTFVWQIALLKPDNQADCLMRFKSNRLVGWLDAAGPRRRQGPLMSRLPEDPEGFIRTNTALETPAMVPEFRLWLATEYVPIWQATEAWLEEKNVDPPYWAFCWPGGQAVARYILDNPATVAGKRVIDFAAGSGVSSMAAARAGRRRWWPTTSTSFRWSRPASTPRPTVFRSTRATRIGWPRRRKPRDRRSDRGRRLLRARDVGAGAGLAAQSCCEGPAGAAGRPRPQLFQRAGPGGTGPATRFRPRCSSRIGACAKPSLWRVLPVS